MVGMKSRYLESAIEELCFEDHKMAFVSGPRQCGKTTLGRLMLRGRGHTAYFNWDDIAFRRQWIRDPRGIVPSAPGGAVPRVVLDEVHKAPKWKRMLKGIHDTLSIPADILVTGSARLNVYRRGGDSLVGRYYHFRLHPFSVREWETPEAPTPEQCLDMLRLHSGHAPHGRCLETLEAMMAFGPFPEPLIQRDPRKAGLWRRSRVERVIREDVRDMSRTTEIGQIELLAALLPERVGSPITLARLQELMEVSHPTIKRWLTFLQELYYVFLVRPYSRNVVRSIRKEAKPYLWDYAEVDEESARFENLVGSHLLKACDFWTDTGRGIFDLRCLRDKDKREIDFLIVKDGKPWLPVEVKLSADAVAPEWNRFLGFLPCRFALQLCRDPDVWRVHDYANGRVVVASADDALYCFP